jgi:tetratricopeptide (TPR) repeat protein
MSDHPQSRPWLFYLVPVLVLLVAAIAFLPALHNGFVYWDDNEMIVDNINFRGLGWTQLRWMFTTCILGHYQPLSWVTFGIDYSLWGMNPTGYHLTNLILHCANAILFYFVSFRLILLGFDDPALEKTLELRCAAALSALLFAVHPLRVESVAWVTERHDVLSGFFLLLSVLCYLKGVARRRWLIPCLACYALSLLSKAVGVSLPVVLLILDIYPLRRWRKTSISRLVMEKLPFLAMAGVFGVNALFASRQSGALVGWRAYGATQRLAQAFFGIAFYIWKTLVPLNLSPLYELPASVRLWHWPFALSALAVLAAAGLLFWGRRQPAWAAAAAIYVAFLAPVLGTAQSGPQLAADRYTYLSCMSWAALAAAGALKLWRLKQGRPIVASLAVLAVALLTGLARAQISVWHDSLSLWDQVLRVEPDSKTGHNYMANVLLEQGRPDEALAHYHRALSIDPTYAHAHYNLGNALRQGGKLKEAADEYRQALSFDANHKLAHQNLGGVLLLLGDLAGALNEYQKALRIDPEFAEAHYNLGVALARQGKTEEAAEQYRQALRCDPRHKDARKNLGDIFIRQGDVAQAAQQYEQALAIAPGFKEAHSNLGVALARQGRTAEAIEQFRQALLIDKDYAEARRNLAILTRTRRQ